MTELNQYNIYNQGYVNNNLGKKDEIDVLIDKMYQIEELEEIENFAKTNFEISDNENWYKYPNDKLVYVSINTNCIEICAYKNKKQIFGRGWKKRYHEDESS